MKYRIYFTLFLALSFFYSPLFSKDFGKRGEDRQISEEDIADALMKKIQSKFDSGEFDKKIQSAAEKAVKNVGRREPIAGLTDAVKYHTHLYDPVITLQEDIKIPFLGKVLGKKGQKIDPTKTQGNPDFGFLFFDGDNPKHVAWAKEQDDFYDWVLVKGDFLELGESEDKWVYFDQGGELTTKFKIKHIPCRVSPEGKCLRIEEIPLK